MNKDIFAGRWKEMRGQIKEWWGKLTDDDLEQVGGKFEKLIGLLQEKYGYTRLQAEEEFNQRTRDLTTMSEHGVSRLERMFEQLADQTQKTVASSAKTFQKGFEQGLSQYNAKAQDVADKVPGEFSKKIAGYPWVTITVSLALGLLLGVILKTGRQPVG